MPALATPMGKVLLLGQRSWPYLLLARFDATKAAPLGTPLAVDIGTLTVVDATGILSQAGGALVMNGTPAADSGVNTTTALARVAGRTVIGRWTPSVVAAGSPRFGWSQNPSSSNDYDIGLDYSSTTAVRIKTSVTVIDTVTLGAAPHDLAAVLRATGGFVLGRAGGSGPYTLLWVYNAISVIEYAKAMARGTVAVNSALDDLRVLDLPAPWNSDYGIATQRLAGSRAQGDAFTHMSDCVLEYVITTLDATVDIQFSFRQQDASNKWTVNATAAGALVLYERVANVPTARASTAGAVVNGSRVVITAEGTTIKVYADDVPKITYASATNFQTATSGTLNVMTGVAAVSNIVTWPRTLALPQGV